MANDSSELDIIMKRSRSAPLKSWTRTILHFKSGF